MAMKWQGGVAGMQKGSHSWVQENVLYQWDGSPVHWASQRAEKGVERGGEVGD